MKVEGEESQGGEGRGERERGREAEWKVENDSSRLRGGDDKHIHPPSLSFSIALLSMRSSSILSVDIND